MSFIIIKICIRVHKRTDTTHYLSEHYRLPHHMMAVGWCWSSGSFTVPHTVVLILSYHEVPVV